MSNYREFKELIKKYEAITIKDILFAEEKMYRRHRFACFVSSYGRRVAELITGFGCTKKCTLCTAVDKDCSKCTWIDGDVGCISYRTGSIETYTGIAIAKTPDELLIAFKERAKFMRAHLLKFYGITDI